MGETCISIDEVRRNIEAADKTLNECFDMLMDLRHGLNDLQDILLRFQPLLSECLFDLMQFYQKLHREKDELISKKGQYDKATFANIMKTNALYCKTVSTAIEIGKNLGDAFAWFFYRDNRIELEKHFEHPSTGLYVGGIGGKGELEFIKNNSNIDGLYVLYHSITTMLRIGDFSLYDIKHGIVGIGELKTKEVDGKLQVTATITARVDLKLSKLPSDSDKDFNEKIKTMQKDFPKLGQQLKTHNDLLRAKESEFSSEFYTSYEHGILNSLTSKFPLAINSDKSLLLVAAWSRFESLFDVLTENESASDLPEDFDTKAKALIVPKSPHNKFFIGKLNTQISILSSPILWWDIGEKICRDIYFKKVGITTIFNPAKFLQYYINDGFSVTTSDHLKKTDIHKVIGEHRIDVGNFESLCYLITNSLMKTTDAYASSKQLICAIENGDFQPGSKVEMHIRLDSFGKRDTDNK